MCFRHIFDLFHDIGTASTARYYSVNNQHLGNPYIDLEGAMRVALDDQQTIDYGEGKAYAVLTSNSLHTC